MGRVLRYDNLTIAIAIYICILITFNMHPDVESSRGRDEAEGY